MFWFHFSISHLVGCLTSSLIPEAALLCFGWSFHCFSQCWYWDVALRKFADYGHWVVHKIHQILCCSQGARVPCPAAEPHSGKVSKNDFDLSSPTVTSIALGWEGGSWNYMQIPQSVVQPQMNISLWGNRLWDFPWVIFSPEAMSRVTAQSLTHKGVKHGMPGSSSDLMLEEKVLFSTFSFWHDCTPLSSSYSFWTLNSLHNPLANHKIPFFLPTCFTLLCY